MTVQVAYILIKSINKNINKKEHITISFQYGAGPASVLFFFLYIYFLLLYFLSAQAKERSREERVRWKRDSLRWTRGEQTRDMNNRPYIKLK